MPLLLLLLVAQLLDGTHRPEHHLGRQLGARRTAGLAAAGRGLAIHSGVCVGVGARIRDVVVVEVATAAALMRHDARVLLLRTGFSLDAEVMWAFCIFGKFSAASEQLIRLRLFAN